ncbi:phage tail protein [uncultured Streptococcus sp.]|uniref:phage tail protein n=1 Tax=uncultured Streptococcus sp. TaxID=83427 RepID=UPI0025CC786B|nr:phage tail protein [uncultured Streptococcus sp.]
MITFLDENDVEYGALSTIKATNAVNGERSLTGTIVSGDYVLSNIERGWRLRFDDEYYVVTYAKPVDEGRDVQVEFDAVHQFFWDFDKSSVYDQLADGSHTFVAYLDFIFKNSGYSYTVDSALNVYAFEKQSFGLKKRLTLFNDIITSTGVEFQVNGKVVRILEKVGTDLSTVVRKNFNMNELTIEKNIGDFVTYQKGYGAYFDEEDHSKGRLEVEYTSPLASVYGKLEAEPFVDERYSQSSSLLAVLKENVDNSYTISVSLDMEDLTRAGYKYKQPIAGDYIMAINETLDFQEKIRIVSFTSEYDVQGILVKHDVTCNDIGTVKKLSASYNLTKKQAASASSTASNAYSIANKALVSADGKNTNYYGDSFPVDNPKGTLKTGDLLFLTVGDTVKQYYWNGAEWVTNPVVSDVEAFKEQIAEELKDVPNREEFENKISEEIATSKAEIETQIETAKTQAESNAKEYADTINQETAKVAELAKTAADEIKADLVNVKSDLTSTSIIANNAQAAVDEAKQDLAEVASDLNTAKQDFADSVAAVNTKVDSTKVELTQAKQDLMSHAQQLQTQANAQTELTKRVTTVETTANGTKTTVNELTKTVAQNGKDITSVTNRTKTVEDDLANTKTTLTQVQTTADSASQKTATLETGLNGLNAKFDSLSVGGVNLFKGSRDFSGTGWVNNSNGVYAEDYQGVKIVKTQAMWNGRSQYFEVKAGEEYVFSAYVKSSAETDRVTFYLTHSSKEPRAQGWVVFESANSWDAVSFDLTDEYQRIVIKIKITTDGWIMPRLERSNSEAYLFFGGYKLERGNIATDYSPNETDLEQKVAEYKQNADQNYASLQSTVQNLDGTVQANKTTAEQTAQGFKTRIESLETYKNGESERANAYFESAKTETAKQLTAERTAIAKDYVAKSTYTSDVTGIRNELSATTSTANATKTNLANYQASNDKVVANLQSNLQTANGNISNLQTKVEAVPGQITSAVSAVEGKIPTSVGSVNLFKGSRDFSGTNWDGTAGVYAEDYQDVKIFKKQSMWGGRSQYFEAKIGEEYVFSAYVKSSAKTDRVTFYLVNSSKEPQAGGVVSFDSVDGRDAVSFDLTDEYKRIAIKIKITSAGWIMPRIERFNNEAYLFFGGYKLERGNIATDWSPAPEDTVSQISSLSSQIKQTADGMTLLATKTELNTAKSELQSGISTATSKANNAQATANNNAQTISTHTTQISALNTGLSAKVSQTDFNTLSGRVTTAENNITAKANELSSKITSVEGKIPTSVGGTNYLTNISSNWQNKYVAISGDETGSFIQQNSTTRISPKNFIAVEAGKKYTISLKELTNADYYFKVTMSTVDAYGVANSMLNKDEWIYSDSYTFTAPDKCKFVMISVGCDAGVTPDDLNVKFNIKLERGNIITDWSPSPEDYDNKLATVQSEFKQTTDSIKASVQSLDNSTVKSSSLTINTDGVVIKAGKSTSDFANAVGSYFSVNQNAINLFSDNINVKGNMIVSGAITSDKIASKQINTAHLNGKIITADVISSNAVTADAIKAGAVTTDKMSANSINGDRITAGTLDAAKIKAGSISASQIASGTLTSEQIKAGTIKSINIEASAITSDKIASNSIDASKIVTNGLTANIIKGGKLQSLSNATNFELDTGKLFYNHNNTGVFRVQSGASTMGLKFTNTAITVNGSSKVLSRVILGGDRRESTLDDGKWDQGGFTGIVAETINGVASNAHDKADTLRAIGDNIYFTHSYETDALTGVSAAGWKMETYAPDTSYKGNVVLKPYGVSYRQSNIVVGDLRLDNGDGSGYWMRATINVLKACFGHIVNGGISSDALNAIKSELNKISGT